MYKVYSDNFYSNTEIKESFEQNYVNKIIGVAKELQIKVTKTTDVETNYNVTNNRLKGLFEEFQVELPSFPESFDKLLVLTPKQMAEIYVYYKKNTSFQEKVLSMFNDVYGPKDGIKHLLDYSNDFSEYIIDYFINIEDENVFTIKNCFYCNHAYINTFTFSIEDVETNEIIEQPKQQYDLDHFIPKGSCPLFSLCLYNFVPSCQVCNSRIKLKTEYYDGQPADELELLFPTSQNYQYDESLRFHIIHVKDDPDFDPSAPVYVKNKNDFEIELEPQGNKIYLLEANAFQIIPRYKKHITEFLTYIDKARKYPPSYFLLLAEQKSQADSDNLKEAIFSHNLRNDEKLIFRKIYNDIDLNLENENIKHEINS